MKSFECRVQSFQGLHALSALRLAKGARRFSSVITAVYKERKANVKNVMELMGLKAGQGAEIHFIIEGEDEEQAAEELTALCLSFL
ncbi:MAG: HPr family phosphocarrier protein [Dorea sp.]|nr:HPr family phosphocarrier protein [Dorea sp.]